MGLRISSSRRVDRLVTSLCNLIIHSARVEAAAQPIIDTFGGIAITAVIVYGGARVIEGRDHARRLLLLHRRRADGLSALALAVQGQRLPADGLSGGSSACSRCSTANRR